MSTVYTNEKQEVSPDVKLAPLDDAPIRHGSIVAEQILLHSHDADVAMKALEGFGADVEIDEATNKRLLRKIDWNLMPVRLCRACGVCDSRMTDPRDLDHVRCVRSQLP